MRQAVWTPALELGDRLCNAACSEGGVDVAEPCLQRIGVVVTEADYAGEIKFLLVFIVGVRQRDGLRQAGLFLDRPFEVQAVMNSSKNSYSQFSTHHLDTMGHHHFLWALGRSGGCWLAYNVKVPKW